MKKYLLALVALSLVVFGSYSINKTVATPTRLAIPVSCSTQGTSATSISTSSLSYMTPGTATTTATCNIAKAGLGTDVFDETALVVNFTASSTSSVLGIALEYSNNGIDWHQDNLTLDAAAGASEAIATPNSFSWTYASTTVGGAAVSSNLNRTAKILRVNTPSQFVRAVFSITGANGGVHAYFVGKTINP